MSFDRSLLELMPDTCVIKQPASVGTPSLYGVTEWAVVGSTHRCRYTSKREEFRLSDGGTVTQTGTLVVHTTARFSPESKITLSDGTEPAILGIEFPWDQDGQHHARIKFGYRSGN